MTTLGKIPKTALHRQEDNNNNNNCCKGTFWFVSLKGKRIMAQRVQHNEFVKSGLEIRLQWDGASLPTDTSIRDFQHGKAGYVANAVK